MTILTGDLNHFPDPDDAMINEHFKIDAPAFCDPGLPDRSNGSMICSRDNILRAIALRPLAFEPWTWPLYSNTGFNLLGWATAEAAGKNTSALLPESDQDKTNWEDLLRYDVFDPLEMKDSSFWVPLEKRDNVAVPAEGVPNFIDLDFTSTFNPYYYPAFSFRLRIVPEECTQQQTILLNLSIKYYSPRTQQSYQIDKFESGLLRFTSLQIVKLQ
jgi:Beta-lactamase